MDPKPQVPTGIPPFEISPQEADGIYSNIVFISHSPSEVILDFGRVMPGVPKSRIFSRIIMTPQHARGLQTALAENLRRYEEAFGPIRMPENGPRKDIGF